MSTKYKMTIPGHCYPLKTHRPIQPLRTGGKGSRWMFQFKSKAGLKWAGCRPSLGKTDKLRDYQERAVYEIMRQWAAPGGGRMAPLEGKVGITITIYYSGQQPDAFGPSETIFDILQDAKVVRDDVQLVPCGTPAISRVHCKKAVEHVEILVWDLEEQS